MRPLPPLNALRAFEATARHRSVRNAARELCVTPSAVSHQLRVLEEWLGVRLLRRSGRSLELTERGRSYLPSVSSALEELSRGTTELVGQLSACGPIQRPEREPASDPPRALHDDHDRARSGR